MNKVIVTMAIGDKYSRFYDKHCKAGFEEYADKYGYEYICIKTPLDKTHRASDRSPAWQKLLILSQEWSSRYDQVVWVDSDILINNLSALDITFNTPIEKVSAVEAYSIPTKALHDEGLLRQYSEWTRLGVPFIKNLTPASYYENRGIFAPNLNEVLQTGVFVSSPKFHREIFEYIYQNYEDYHGSHWNYEMPAMSYELVRNNLVNWIDPKYNFCVGNLIAIYFPEIFSTLTKRKKAINKIQNYFETGYGYKSRMQALRNIFNDGYFMHFAGCQDLMNIFSTYLQKNAS